MGQTETYYLKNFRANLKELMEDRGVNSEKLGKGIGINPSTIRRWFYDRDPKAESVRRVADYFGRFSLRTFAGI